MVDKNCYKTFLLFITSKNINLGQFSNWLRCKSQKFSKLIDFYLKTQIVASSLFLIFTIERIIAENIIGGVF